MGDTYSLGELCCITKGQQVNAELLTTSGKYYVMNGGMEPSGYYHQANTAANTISISEGGNSCGYVQYNQLPFWSGGHCYTLESLSINTFYMFHYLKAMEDEIMNLRIGSGLPNIQKKELSRFQIIVPSERQQAQICQTFNALSRKVKQEESITLYYIKQKQYLLRSMFI